MLAVLRRHQRKLLVAVGALLLLGMVFSPTLFASGSEADDVPASDAGADYRAFRFFGVEIENRVVVWVVAQLHLMFGAFVLGVPIFVMIAEIIGVFTGDPRYDRLAHEFTRLLSAAFSTTAALGGLMAFTLFGLYPAFSNHLTGTFHKTMYVYGTLFFAEAFSLYLFYYSWHRLEGKRPGISVIGAINCLITSAIVGVVGFGVGKFLLTVIRSIGTWGGGADPTVHEKASGTPILAWIVAAAAVLLFLWKYGRKAMEDRKWLHINLGVFVNLAGITLMLIANSWATYVMSPPGVEQGELLPKYWDADANYIGPLWEAVNNPLWWPVNIHRLIANVAFGGFICGAYAAVKFLGAKKFAERAHYDWMGYVGNVVGIAAMIPLPFAGYYLGREIYSYSATMGQDMMGGTFSWTFIVQALLIGILFIGANFYMWCGMYRIRGAERYSFHILVMLAILVVCFGVWATPHNLPMSGEERQLVGGQFHPTLAKLGLMSAKNAVVYFIIITTFFSFLLYRRANKGRTKPFAEHGSVGYITLGVLGGVCSWMLLNKGFQIFHLDPTTVDLAAEVKPFLMPVAYVLFLHVAALWVGIGLTFLNRGILGQGVIFASAVAIVTFYLGYYGFVIMREANPFLRDIAVVQVLITLSCLIVNIGIDIFHFRGAEQTAGIRWGKMTSASQYALLTICISIVLLMGLMGYIRSGLRKDWHVFSVVRDTSESAYTPSIFEMSKIVAVIVILFFGLMAFVFWLSSLGEKDEEIPEEWYAAAREEGV